MPFDSSRNRDGQRSMWLTNFYPRLTQATTDLRKSGFNQQRVMGPIAIYFPFGPSSLNQNGPVDILSLLSRVTRGEPVEPTPTDSGSGVDPDSVPDSISTTTGGLMSTTGGPGDGGSGVPGDSVSAGVTTPGDYTTGATGSPTSAPSTTGGGGTEGGGTTDGSGSVIIIDQTTTTSSGGTGTYGTPPEPVTSSAPPAQNFTCEDCLDALNCGGGVTEGEVSYPYTYSDCFHPTVASDRDHLDQVAGCPLLYLDLGFIAKELCWCAIIEDCANCTSTGFFDTCAMRYACCYIDYTIDPPPDESLVVSCYSTSVINSEYRVGTTGGTRYEGCA